MSDITTGPKTPEASDTLLEQVQGVIDPLVPRLQSGMATVLLDRGATPESLRLRGTRYCGAISIAIAGELEVAGIPASPVSRRLSGYREELPYIPRSHVIDRVGSGDDPIIVDGSYSQLLSPFGLTPHLARALYPYRDLYPPAQVLVFRSSRLNEVADDLVAHMEQFWGEFADDEAYQTEWQMEKLQPATGQPDKLRDFLMDMYNLESYEPLDLSDEKDPDLAAKTAAQILRGETNGVDAAVRRLFEQAGELPPYQPPS